MTGRLVAAWGVGLGLLALASGAIVGSEDTPRADRGTVKLTDEAKKVHAEGFVFDGHNDVPWRLLELDDLSFRKIDLEKHQKDMHTDIPRLRQGNVGAQFWSAYVPSSTGQI